MNKYIKRGRARKNDREGRKPHFIALFLVSLSVASVLITLPAQSPGVPCDPADYVNISSAGYNAVPPFVTKGGGTPNVLILFANSADLYEFAYKVPEKYDRNGDGLPNDCNAGSAFCTIDASFDPNTRYYGYFEIGVMYRYDSGGYFAADAAGGLPGNFLNWLTMRKIDILKKVAIGGKYLNRAQKNSPKLLEGQNKPNHPPNSTADTEQMAHWDYFKTYNGRYYMLDGDSNSGIVNICTDSTCSDFAERFEIKILNPAAPTGVLHTFVDEYLDGSDDAVRFGLMTLNEGNRFEGGKSNEYDGGDVRIPVSQSSRNDFFSGLANADPLAHNPLGESLYQAVRYFQNGPNAYHSGNAGTNDPVTDNPCEKNFVIILTSGESTKDKNLPGTSFSGVSLAPVMDADFNVVNYMNEIDAIEGAPPNNRDSDLLEPTVPDHDGTYYLGGVAYYAHTNDLRDDVDGYQNLTVYTVYAFGSSSKGEQLLKETSKYGGFEDVDGDNQPGLSSEWDSNGDGNPDTYFPASSGPALEAQLKAALLDILKRSSSGTAASILTTSGKGDAVIYQALFYPNTTADKFGTDSVNWIGNITSLFIDKSGNVREDSNGNWRLDTTGTCGSTADPGDCIIKMDYDVVQGAIAYRYEDTNGNGIPDDNSTADDFKIKGGFVPIENVKTIWDAGKLLLARNVSSNPRKIFVDYAYTGYYDFNDTNASLWRDYLRAADDTESAKIINYLHGEAVSGYRSRTVTYKGTTGVWKLGDIINSSPVAVSRPKENYDLIYGDSTYRKFFEKYRDRRVMVYVGGNDGMLHAFNGGFYNSAQKQFYKNLDTSSDPAVYDNSSSLQLGQEMWAYLPKQLLPHVKWLTETSYKDTGHVYYVDLTPKVVDARIFEGEFNDPSGTHPYGWGTILIGGMRFGGRPMNICNGGVEETLASAYFALDITDPESPPQLLWTFVPNNGTLTSGFPGVARVLSRDINGDVAASGDKWYMIVGSGPKDFDTNSNITTSTLANGELYVVEMESGTLVRTFTTSEGIVDAGGFFADTITVDANVYLRGDAVVDVVYSGQSYYHSASSSYRGKMYRLNTKNSPDPSQWVLSTLFSTDEPITSAPSAALDGKGNLWVFFGTGKFIGSADKNSTDSGAFYGIKDKAQPWLSPYTSTVEISKNNLFNSTNTTVSSGGSTVASLEESLSYSNWSGLMLEIDASDGWYIDHASITTDDLYNSDPALNQHLGERVISKPTVLGGLVIWPTYQPTQGTDSCVYEGNSNIYSVYYETGTAFKQYVFSDEKVSQPTTVSRSKSLGYGMPSSIGAIVTESGGIKGFSQQSTGSILEIEAISTYSLKPGLAGWKEDNL